MSQDKEGKQETMKYSWDTSSDKSDGDTDDDGGSLYHPYRYEGCYQPDQQEDDEQQEQHHVIDDDSEDDGDSEQEEEGDRVSSIEHRQNAVTDDSRTTANGNENNNDSIFGSHRYHWLLSRTNHQSNSNFNTSSSSPMSNSSDNNDHNEREGTNTDHYQIVQRYSHGSDSITTDDTRNNSDQHHQQPQQNHFHIYYNSNHDDNTNDEQRQLQRLQYSYDPRPSSQWTSCGWFLISLIVIIAHCLYWYGPAAPPPPPPIFDGMATTTSSSPSSTDSSSIDIYTWSDFWKQQSQLLWAIISTWIHVTQYVSFWTWQSIQHDYKNHNTLNEASTQSTKKTDGRLLNDDNILGTTRTRNSGSVCDFQPSRWNTWTVFGQELAIESLERALSKQESSSSSSDLPLVLYATGGRSTGKKHLANEIEWHIQQDCPKASTIPTMIHISSLQEAREALLEDDIISQAVSPNNGKYNGPPLLILLSDIDEWSSNSDDDAIASLDHLLSYLILGQPVSSGNVVSNDLNQQTTRSQRSNCIIYITSSVGKITIDKAIRKLYSNKSNDLSDNDRVALSSLLSASELESIVTYKLRSYHGIDNNNNESSSKILSYLFESNKIDVLPFVPLDQQGIQGLLQYQLYVMFGINEVSKRATDYLLNDQNHWIMEWQTWIQKSSGEQIWNPHVPKGAQALQDVVLERISNSCYSNESKGDDDEGNADDATIGTKNSFVRLEKKEMSGPRLQILECVAKGNEEDSYKKDVEADYNDEANENDDCTIKCEFSI